MNERAGLKRAGKKTTGLLSSLQLLAADHHRVADPQTAYFSVLEQAVWKAELPYAGMTQAGLQELGLKLAGFDSLKQVGLQQVGLNLAGFDSLKQVGLQQIELKLVGLKQKRDELDHAHHAFCVSSIPQYHACKLDMSSVNSSCSALSSTRRETCANKTAASGSDLRAKNFANKLHKAQSFQPAQE